MLWVGLVCVIVGAGVFAAGLVLFAKGAGVAPAQRTEDDRTGLKRAASRVQWGDVLRRLPRSLRVMIDEDADRSDKLMALGSLCVLLGALAWLVAALAFITGLV